MLDTFLNYTKCCTNLKPVTRCQETVQAYLKVSEANSLGCRADAQYRSVLPLFVAAISRSTLFTACLMCCGSGRRFVGVAGMHTTSFTNLQRRKSKGVRYGEHEIPRNSNRTSNPLARKHCLETGIDLCMEIWRSSLLLERNVAPFYSPVGVATSNFTEP